MKYRINKRVYIGSIRFVQAKKKLTKTSFLYHQQYLATNAH